MSSSNIKNGEDEKMRISKSEMYFGLCIELVARQCVYSKKAQ